MDQTADDPPRARLGTLLLVPGLVLFALRATIRWMGDDPALVPHLDTVTALSGAMSLVGLLLVAEARRASRVVLGAGVALVGHFVISQVSGDVAAGFVYFGTAMVIADSEPLPLIPGLIAFAGALARGEWMHGHALVAGGALLLAVAAVHRIQVLAALRTGETEAGT